MGSLAFDIDGDGTIGKTISTSRLSVPTNQRSYAWDKTNALELFDDLAGALLQGEEYFLGSVVINKSGASGTPEVVDGQQRLATSVILIAAIRDYLLEVRDDEFAGDIERKYIMSRAYPSREVLPQLSLNVTDNEYFSKRILSRPGTDERNGAHPSRASHRRILANAQAAATRVKQIVAGATPDQRTQRLSDWFEYLDTRARVIVVKVESDTHAYVMFETLNDRGAELSKVDLIKNYLFGRSGDRFKEAEQRWYSMVGAIESSSAKEEEVTSYVRHYWASIHGPVRERELFAVIKDKVKGKPAVLQLADQLAEYAPMYVALANPANSLWHSYPPSAKRHIETLILLRMIQIRTLLLALVSQLEKSEISRCFKLLVSFVVRFLVVGGHGGGTLEKHYATAAQKVRTGKITNAAGLLTEMRDVVPNDAEFREAFARATVSQPQLARYYLRTMEVVERGVAEPEDVPNEDEEVVNLEHILPESPGLEWSLEPDVMSAYFRRIGNMALIQRTPNEEMGNAGFESTKKSVLENSEFHLTKLAGSYDKWGPEEINERQDKLAELAVKTWPLKA